MRAHIPASLLCFAAMLAPAAAEEGIATRWCGEVVQNLIATPASYRLVSAGILGANVIVQFDAQNLYGALVRQTATCEFRISDGTVEIAAVQVGNRYAGYEQVGLASLMFLMKENVGKVLPEHTALSFSRP